MAIDRAKVGQFAMDAIDAMLESFTDEEIEEMEVHELMMITRLKGPQGVAVLRYCNVEDPLLQAGLLQIASQE